jgi:cyclophilin family peptidyl-prolyl cis-trans isomerase
MGTNKRERQKANRAARIAAAEEQERASARRRRFLLIGVGAVALLALAFLYSVLADSSDSSDSSDEATTTSSTDELDEGGEPGEGGDGPVIDAPPPGATITGETPCPPADGSAERTTVFEQAPPMCIDPDASYTAIMSTSLGDLAIELDAEAAPLTVNNFVVLARYHYYDGVPFHRVVADFVAQAGDAVPNPDGLGSGGPGYRFADELPDSLDAYQPGTVAMANSGPDTNGSQFFIYYGPNQLPAPAYSVFGRVTEGLDTVGAELAATATPSEVPSQLVTIDGIEIIEG